MSQGINPGHPHGFCGVQTRAPAGRGGVGGIGVFVLGSMNAGFARADTGVCVEFGAEPFTTAVAELFTAGFVSLDCGSGLTAVGVGVLTGVPEVVFGFVTT